MRDLCGERILPTPAERVEDRGPADAAHGAGSTVPWAGLVYTVPRQGGYLFLAAIFASVLLLCLTVVALASPAQQNPVQDSAASTLPPRPTLTPTSTPTPTPTPWIGAHIQLRVDDPAAQPSTGLRSVVQWQDAQGDWHDVGGWQADLAGGFQRWWVSPADFGKGPFRWVAFSAADGAMVGISEPFHLPTEPYSLVDVVISKNQ